VTPRAQFSFPVAWGQHAAVRDGYKRPGFFPPYTSVPAPYLLQRRAASAGDSEANLSGLITFRSRTRPRSSCVAIYATQKCSALLRISN